MRVVTVTSGGNRDLVVPDSLIALVNYKVEASYTYFSEVKKIDIGKSVTLDQVGSLLAEQYNQYKKLVIEFEVALQNIISDLQQIQARSWKNPRDVAQIQQAINTLNSAMKSGDDRQLNLALKLAKTYADVQRAGYLKNTMLKKLSSLRATINRYKGIDKFRMEYIKSYALQIAAVSLSLCPVRTGRLAASIYVEIAPKGFSVIYTAPYALYVHENLTSSHPIHQIGSRAYLCYGQSKFLEIAWNRVIGTSSPHMLTYAKGTIGLMGKLDPTSLTPRFISTTNREDIL